MKEKEKMDHSLSVIVLIVIFSILAGLFMLKDLSLTGSVTVQTISYLQEGNQLELEVRNVKNVKDLTVNVVQDLKNSKIIVEETTPPESFNGHFLSAFKISSDQENNFGKVQIGLKIKRSDLISVSDDELKVYRDNQELVTELNKKEKEFVYYQVVSPGLGIFVIGKKELVEEIVPPAEVVLLSEESAIPVPKGFWQIILDFFRKLFGE